MPRKVTLVTNKIEQSSLNPEESDQVLPDEKENTDYLDEIFSNDETLRDALKEFDPKIQLAFGRIYKMLVDLRSELDREKNKNKTITEKLETFSEYL